MATGRDYKAHTLSFSHNRRVWEARIQFNTTDGRVYLLPKKNKNQNHVHDYTSLACIRALNFSVSPPSTIELFLFFLSLICRHSSSHINYSETRCTSFLIFFYIFLLPLLTVDTYESITNWCNSVAVEQHRHPELKKKWRTKKESISAHQQTKKWQISVLCKKKELIEKKRIGFLD